MTRSLSDLFFRSDLLGVLLVVVIIILLNFAHDSFYFSLYHRMSLTLFASRFLLSSLSLVFLFFLYEMHLSSSLNLSYYIDLIRIDIFLIVAMVLKDPYWYITNLILIICLVLYLTICFGEVFSAFFLSLLSFSFFISHTILFMFLYIMECL